MTPTLVVSIQPRGGLKLALSVVAFTIVQKMWPQGHHAKSHTKPIHDLSATLGLVCLPRRELS